MSIYQVRKYKKKHIDYDNDWKIGKDADANNDNERSTGQHTKQLTHQHTKPYTKQQTKQSMTDRNDGECKEPNVIYGEDISDYVYLDNCGTTYPSDDVRRIMTLTMKQGNPSGVDPISRKSRELIDRMKEYIVRLCRLNDRYAVIITSGASESNNYAIRTYVESYIREHHSDDTKPHVIISAVEHKTSIDCCKNLEKTRMADVTYVQPNIYGVIGPDEVEKHITSRTCLISIMQANNETGVINMIDQIGELAHQYDIPFHTDCAQSFGKFGMIPDKENVDAFSVSFHKLHGPPGIGLLVIRKDNCELCPLIGGSQNEGLRGGTENVPLIAGARIALDACMDNRVGKNRYLIELRDRLISGLYKMQRNVAGKDPYVWPKVDDDSLTMGDIVLFTGYIPALPNMLLLSLNGICRLEVQNMLLNDRIIIGVGSACNKGASSYVLTSMGVPESIKKGAMRISWCDDTTVDEIDYLIDKLSNIYASAYGGRK